MAAATIDLPRDVDPETLARASEPCRGRAATNPFGIPPKGWKDVLFRLWHSFFEDRILLISAGATFYLVLAVFPALSVFVSLYGLVSDPATIEAHIEFFGQVLPQSATEILVAQLRFLIEHDRSALSFRFAIGLCFALWSANNGVKTLFEAMNVAYGEREKRSFLRLNLKALSFTLAATMIASALVFALGVAPLALRALGAPDVLDQFVNRARWPLAFVLVVLAIAMTHRYGPSRNRARWIWVLPGATFTAVAWFAAALGFSWYLHHFADYQAIYGSLGAVIGFMMWVWVSALVLILGAELNAEMEHQTAMDTTDGPSKPLGRRGARMADTIGKSSARDPRPTGEKRGLFGLKPA